MNGVVHVGDKNSNNNGSGNNGYDGLTYTFGNNNNDNLQYSTSANGGRAVTDNYSINRTNSNYQYINTIAPSTYSTPPPMQMHSPPINYHTQVQPSQQHPYFRSDTIRTPPNQLMRANSRDRFTPIVTFNQNYTTPTTNQYI